jgi:hypothetical protein
MLTEAMIQILDNETEKSLNDYPAWDWGKNTEKLSENYEEDLYGNTA